MGNKNGSGLLQNLSNCGQNCTHFRHLSDEQLPNETIAPAPDKRVCEVRAQAKKKKRTCKMRSAREKRECEKKSVGKEECVRKKSVRSKECVRKKERVKCGARAKHSACEEF